MCDHNMTESVGSHSSTLQPLVILRVGFLTAAVNTLLDLTPVIKNKSRNTVYALHYENQTLFQHVDHHFLFYGLKTTRC